MNGPSTVNYPTNINEQSIGKFHVTNVDKVPINPLISHDETANVIVQQQVQQSSAPSTTATADESAYPSRFQMIRVDRNFTRGRWKVNDYEPPEHVPTTTNAPVNATENESVNISHASTLPTVPTTIATAPTNTTLTTNVHPTTHADSNVTSSAALAATAASAAAAAATAFQQQQQRLAMNNPATVVPPANVPPPAGLLAYPPTALPNMPAPNQSYILPNHPQYGYYTFYPPPHYSAYAAQWAALAAANPYLAAALPPPQQPGSQIPAGNLGDPIRLTDTGPDITSENSVISSNPFPNPTADHLQNAQLAAAAAAAAPFLYGAPHSTYMPQVPPNTASPYATIAAYHAAAPPSTIIPPTSRPVTLAQVVPNNATDVSQQLQFQQQPIPSYPVQSTQQQAPILTSPKQDASSTKATTAQQPAVPKIPTTTATTSVAAATTIPVKPLVTTANGAYIVDPSKSVTTTASTNQIKPLTLPSNTVNTDTSRSAVQPSHTTYIADLLSTSPSLSMPQQPARSLMSSITIQTGHPANISSPSKVPTASLNDLWTYTTASPQLNLSQTAAQTAAVTAVAAMGLLNSEGNQNTEIANEILKELTTPTKQNIATDIDNKISAAMDLVKMHLLSAVRDEVTELRQQIQTLKDKLSTAENENAFLRQHVPSEISAQYTPFSAGLSSISDQLNPQTTATAPAATVPPSSTPSSQINSMATVTSNPPSVTQQLPTSTTSQPPPASANLPST